MRFQSFLLPVAAVSAAVLESRQLGAKLAKVETLAPEVRKDAIHQIARFGPITVKGKNGKADSGQQNYFFLFNGRSAKEGFCQGCTVLKGRVGLLNVDGSKISPENDVYIHHILTFDTSKPANNFVDGCGAGLSGIIGAKFIGSGEDNNNVDVWYTNREGETKSGFHIGANDNFGMNMDVVSYAPANKQIYLTLELEYLKGIHGLDATQTLLSVACNRQIKIASAGATNTTSGEYKFTQDGTILVAKGHLHTGGEKMVMYINGKFACESTAAYGGAKGDQAIDSMSLCTTNGIRVKKNDRMTMEARYDTSKHPIRHESHGMGAGMPDVMGMFDVTFAPDVNRQPAAPKPVKATV